MIILIVYLLSAAYLLGAMGERRSYSWPAVVIVIFWLPAALAVISTSLATRYFGEKNC